MFVVNQNRNALWHTQNCESIELHPMPIEQQPDSEKFGAILAFEQNRTICHSLGLYKDKRAKQVFAALCRSLSAKRSYKMPIK